jgi:cellulose biosynthesis protein BcsQ
LSYKGLEIIDQTLGDIKKYNKKIRFLGTIVTMHDPRTKHARMVMDKIKQNFPFFNVVITRSIKFSNAAIAGLPIRDFAENNFSGTAGYKKLAREVDKFAREEN